MNDRGHIAVVLVLDGVGISTLDHVAGKTGNECILPNLSDMGLGRILSHGKSDHKDPAGKGFASRVVQASASADSVIGHREMMGVISTATYGLFPDGFPRAYIQALEKKIERKTIFNKMAGGLEAIEKNHAEHENNGYPIVYASKCDPIIQIAMNEDIIPVNEQRRIIETAFKLAGEHSIPITRAIARPYVRSATGSIIRTVNRHDVVTPLTERTLIHILNEQHVHTIAVGKISDLVPAEYSRIIHLNTPEHIDSTSGIKFLHPEEKDTNPYSLQGTLDALRQASQQRRPHGTFIFTNLVDTDSLYGHTRDSTGIRQSLEQTDTVIGVFKKYLTGSNDLIIVTADHGMEYRQDPCTGETYGYHGLEPLPLLLKRTGCDGLGDFTQGSAETLADVGYYVAQTFGCDTLFVRECRLGAYY